MRTDIKHQWGAFLLFLLGVGMLVGSSTRYEVPNKSTSVNQEFLEFTCIEASPYKSKDDCLKQVNQTHMILTKEKK